MPKTIVDQELERILKLIAQNPHGIGLESIAKVLETVKRRTLQSRLAKLVSQKRIDTSGEGRAVKYFIPKPIANLNVLHRRL